MNARAWVIAVIGCTTDFILASGGAFIAVAAEVQTTPSKMTYIAIIVTGLLAAARRLQALVQLPPMNGPTPPK